MSYISASARVAAIVSRLADPAAAVTRSVAPTATTPLDRLAAVATTPTIPAADPLPGARRTQGFGNSGFHMAPAASRDGVRYPHYHAGVDLSAAEGTPVRAIAGGEVTFAGRDSSGSINVKIRHTDGSESLYGHLEVGPPVRVGQTVEAGTPIGSVGMTGKTTGPHLHLVLKDAQGRPVDPTPAIRTGDLAAAFAADPVLSAFEKSGRPDAFELRNAAARSGVDPYLIAALADEGIRVAPDVVAAEIAAAGSAGAALVALVQRTGVNPDRAAAVLSRWSSLLGGTTA
jgi:hypothetical protein